MYTGISLSACTTRGRGPIYYYTRDLGPALGRGNNRHGAVRAEQRPAESERIRRVDTPRRLCRGLHGSGRIPRAQRRRRRPLRGVRREAPDVPHGVFRAPDGHARLSEGPVGLHHPPNFFHHLPELQIGAALHLGRDGAAHRLSQGVGRERGELARGSHGSCFAAARTTAVQMTRRLQNNKKSFWVEPYWPR